MRHRQKIYGLLSASKSCCYFILKYNYVKKNINIQEALYFLSQKHQAYKTKNH